MIMDTHSSFIPHEHHLADAEICLDFLGCFSHLFSCFEWLVWCVCVGV